MHRSRLTVLVVLAAVAACSSHDDAQGTDLLAQDRTLVAGLDSNTRSARLPDACGAIAIAAQPAAGNQRQSRELSRKAFDAEMHGDVQEARSLLRQALRLDATNKSAAYHLGRTSETLGDRAGAMTAYCRYLALTPTTAESAEARQRVSTLSKSVTGVAAGSVVDSVPGAASAPAARPAPAPGVTRARPTAATRRVASRRVERSAPEASTAREAGAERGVASAGNDAPAQNDAATIAPEVDRTTTSASAGGDVAVASAPADQRPATAPPTVSRGPNRTQGAMIGAAAGAIIGAATGRSVKSAVIGAAAGGVLGTAVGRPIRPIR